MSMGQAVEDAVRRRLRSAGGVRVLPRSDQEDLRISVMGAEPVTFVLEVKHRISDEAVHQIDGEKLRERLVGGSVNATTRAD